MDSLSLTTRDSNFDVQSQSSKSQDNMMTVSKGGEKDMTKGQKRDSDALQAEDEGSLVNLEEGETEDATTKRQKLEENPLQIGNILQKVLSFLDFNSIKAARQVNPSWSAEGAKVLLTKCFVKIPSDLQKKESSSSKSELMEEFKSFLSHKSTEVSMIPNITVKVSTDVELWQSLGVLGPQVTSLQLLRLDFVKDKAGMLRNLLDLLPNLKYLKMFEERYCKCCHDFERDDIIQVLVDVMSKPEKAGSPLVISTLRLQPYYDQAIANTEKLSDCKNVLIEKLEFDFSFLDVHDDDALVANYLSKLLSTSRTTLKSLILSDFEKHLLLLEFPSLPALTYITLKLDAESRRENEICSSFSPTFRFSEHVPNLEFFEVETPGPLYRDPYSVTRLFENGGTAASVKSLDFSDGVNNSTLDLFFQVFPNLEDLVLAHIYCSPKLFNSLWTQGKKLKKLTITIELKDKRIADLDSFLTGFTPKTVKKIKKHPKLTPFGAIDMKKVRVNPSILDLKDLEKFRLDISTPVFSDEDKELPKRMLTVAGEYAFKLMSKDARIIISNDRMPKNHEETAAAFGHLSTLPNVVVK